MINDSFASWIFCVLQITAVGSIATLLMSRLLRRRPEMASTLGVTALAICFVLVFLTAIDCPRPFVLNRVSTPSIQARQQSVKPHVVVDETEQELANFRGEDFSAADEGPTFAELWSSVDLVAEVAATSDWWSWLGVIRITVVGGVFLLAMRFLIGTCLIVHLRVSSRDCGDSTITEMVDGVSESLELHCPPRIRVSKWVSGPCLSWLSPNIVFLPVGFEQWSWNERYAGLAHELAHVKRMDAFWRFVSELAWMFTCWQPLTWLLRSQLTLAQELSADRLAASSVVGNANYRKGIAQIALRLEAVGVERRSIFDMSTSVNSSSLIRRINMLERIELVISPREKFVSRLFALATFIGFAWISCWSVEAQQKDGNRAGPDARVARVDAVSSVAGSTRSRASFARPKVARDDVEIYGDCISIRFGELLEHPRIGAKVKQALESTDVFFGSENGTPRTFESVGLPLESLARVDLSIDKLVNGRGPGRELAFILIGGDEFALNVDQEIDWPNLTRELNYLRIYSTATEYKNELNKNLERLRENSKRGRSLVFCRYEKEIAEMIASGQPVPTPTECHDAMWDHVNGGIVTAHMRFGFKFREIEDLLERVTGIQEWPQRFGRSDAAELCSIQSVAIGLDYLDAADIEIIQLAIEPSEKISVERLQALLNRYVTQVLIPHFAETRPKFANNLRDLEFEIAGEDGSQFVVISGDYHFIDSMRLLWQVPDKD